MNKERAKAMVRDVDLINPAIELFKEGLGRDAGELDVVTVIDLSTGRVEARRDYLDGNYQLDRFEIEVVRIDFRNRLKEVDAHDLLDPEEQEEFYTREKEETEKGNNYDLRHFLPEIGTSYQDRVADFVFYRLTEDNDAYTWVKSLEQIDKEIDKM